MEPMLAEGLNKKPLNDIVARVVALNFNCVRLTYATQMFTRYSQNTVTETLDSLKLTQAKEGIAKNNPAFLNLTHVQAFESVVDELGNQGLKVVLDNHISLPKWCCSDNDGNGFFGDADFDIGDWERGLVAAAQQFKNRPQVVGMSLRNELRGSRQNEPDWYRYITEGALLVHQANPEVLVIVSGLNYATDLSFVKNHTLGMSFDNKLVYESHWYSWSVHGNTCDDIKKAAYDLSIFVMNEDRPFPLFLSEFGFDQRGDNDVDNKFMDCFIESASLYNFNWALWALQGSYYTREGKEDYEEVFGVLDANWENVRNLDFLSRLFNMPGLSQNT